MITKIIGTDIYVMLNDKVGIRKCGGSDIWWCIVQINEEGNFCPCYIKDETMRALQDFLNTPFSYQL